MLLAPFDGFLVDIDADISAAETPAAEVVIAQPMRPTAAADPDLQDVRSHSGNALAERDHPEIAGVNQEVGLIVDNAVADPDANAQMIGRQRPKLWKDQTRNHVERVDRRAKQRIERQFRSRGKQSAEKPVQADATCADGRSGTCRCVRHAGIQTPRTPT